MNTDVGGAVVGDDPIQRLVPPEAASDFDSLRSAAIDATNLSHGLRIAFRPRPADVREQPLLITPGDGDRQPCPNSTLAYSHRQALKIADAEAILGDYAKRVAEVSATLSRLLYDQDSRRLKHLQYSVATRLPRFEHMGRQFVTAHEFCHQIAVSTKWLFSTFKLERGLESVDRFGEAVHLLWSKVGIDDPFALTAYELNELEDTERREQEGLECRLTEEWRFAVATTSPYQPDQKAAAAPAANQPKRRRRSQEETDELESRLGGVSQLSESSPKPRGRKSGRPAGSPRSVNDRLRDCLEKSPHEVLEMSAKALATKLGCSASAIKGTSAWTAIQQTRAAASIRRLEG